MEHSFWHNKWEKQEIGFHQDDYNDMMIRFLPELNIQENGTIFVPLCGKTKDIHWLLEQGYQVIGNELSDIAVQQLFEELNLTPTVTETSTIKHYSSRKLKVLQGDVFDLKPFMLGKIDAIYDRAALVALPLEVRQQYTKQLIAITLNAPQLLLTFEYDQSLKDGPPFSITSQEVTDHYDRKYNLLQREHRELEGGLKGLIPANEVAWLLT